MVDMTRARDPDAPWCTTTGRKTSSWKPRSITDFDASIKDAAVTVKRTFRTARQSMAPMEGRGVVAEWDKRRSSSWSTPRRRCRTSCATGLPECLGLDQGLIRVVAPDVGGGFGYKGILLAEEVCLAWLAMKLRRPVRWIEDRREQLTGNANCREHHYEITGYAAADGRLLAIDCEAHRRFRRLFGLSVLRLS